MQAVTRVKLEQASKVKLRMPPRLRDGEGHTFWEETGASLLIAFRNPEKWITCHYGVYGE